MLDDLRAFVAVVDRASLTKAADVLALTQSAVSRRIQQLEDTLNVKLLDRSTKPPTATAVGRRVYAAAIPLLRDVGRLVSIPKEDQDPSGTFRLGLPQLVADVVLFDVVKSVKNKFPALDLRCRTEWSSALQQELAVGDLDAAILMVPASIGQPQGMQVQLIASLEVLVVQSKARPIALGVVQIEDLAEHEWILNPQGCGYRSALQRSMEGVGRQVHLGVDTHGTEIQLRLVAEGFGLGLVPRGLLTRSSYAKDISVVEVSNFTLKLDVWLAAASELGNLQRAYSVVCRILIDCMASLSASDV